MVCPGSVANWKLMPDGEHELEDNVPEHSIAGLNQLYYAQGHPTEVGAREAPFDRA